MRTDAPELAELLRQAFLEGLDLPPDTPVTELAFEKHPHWDSLGHMTLVAAIEKKFGLILDGDEVTGLDSHAAALAILVAKDA